MDFKFYKKNKYNTFYGHLMFFSRCNTQAYIYNKI